MSRIRAVRPLVLTVEAVLDPATMRPDYSSLTIDVGDSGGATSISHIETSYSFDWNKSDCR